MRVRDLPRRILQQIGKGSLQHARRTAVKAGGMFSQLFAASTGFDADELHSLVFDEIVEDANRIRAAADAGDNRVRQFALSFNDLRARLAANDFVKIAHHRWIWMSAEHAAKKIMRGANVGYPIAHGLVDGIFQRARTRIHAANLRAQQPHTKNVEFLSSHVLGAHVDNAFEAQQRAYGGRGDAVLSRPGFGDDAALSHAFGQQSLSETVVDFVRAGVKEIFALEIDFRAAKLLGQTSREK